MDVTNDILIFFGESYIKQPFKSNFTSQKYNFANIIQLSATF